MQAENLKNIFPLNKFSLIFIEKEIIMHGQIQRIDFNAYVNLNIPFKKNYNETPIFLFSTKKTSLTSNLIQRL